MLYFSSYFPNRVLSYLVSQNNVCSKILSSGTFPPQQQEEQQEQEQLFPVIDLSAIATGKKGGEACIFEPKYSGTKSLMELENDLLL